MLKVYSANHPTEAHLVKGILESHGIPCEVQGESLFSARGELPLTPETAPSVWITDDAQIDDARTLIEEYESAAPSDPSNARIWICEKCGEDSEGQFTDCWNCGAPRFEPVPGDDEVQ